MGRERRLGDRTGLDFQYSEEKGGFIATEPGVRDGADYSEETSVVRGDSGYTNRRILAEARPG